MAGTTERHTAGCYTSATIPRITMRRRTCWRISCQPDPEWGPAPTLLLRPRECESTRVARTTPTSVVAAREMRTVLLARPPLCGHTWRGDGRRASPSAARTRGAAALGGTSCSRCAALPSGMRLRQWGPCSLPIALRLSLGGCRRRAGQVSVARQGQGTGSDWGDGTTGDRTVERLRRTRVGGDERKR